MRYARSISSITIFCIISFSASGTLKFSSSLLLGYAVAGIVAFLIMRQLGEMVVEEPVAGSFSHFAYKYWGGFAGFASGWNYWVLYLSLIHI